MANNNAKIKFLSGQYAGSEIELTPFTAIVLGRNPQYQILCSVMKI